MTQEFEHEKQQLPCCPYCGRYDDSFPTKEPLLELLVQPRVFKNTCPGCKAVYVAEYHPAQIAYFNTGFLECSRHPEPAADPQETADGGQGIDIPTPIKSADVSTARDFDRPRAIELAAWAIAHHSNNADGYGLYWGAGMAAVDDMPDTLKDTAKTAMPKPVPPRTLGTESDPPHNGTVERYLIWSNEHRAWWRPNNAGYTVYVTAAGIYSKEDALSTSWKGRDGWRSEQQCPAEIAVPLSSIPEHYRPTE